MLEISHDIALVGAGVVAVLLCLHGIVSLYLLNSLRRANAERAALHREVFGLVRKLEGLTAGKREQMTKQFDRLLDDLAIRLPTAVAAQAGQTIFDTESRILTRLAELEPNLKDDAAAREKMDDLIRSMENLETTIVTVTADTVQNVVAANRQSLFDNEFFPDDTSAGTGH